MKKRGILKFIIFFLPIALIGLILYLGFWLSPQDNLEKAEAVIVVSGGETAARTKEGINIYKNGYADYLIFSGAAEAGDVSNALAMKRIALKSGVSESKIIIEEDSKNTFENALKVKIILEEKGFKKIILVTSPYHQKRAYITFDFVLGPDYQIINRSAIDSMWRKSKWWQRVDSFELTLQELYKIVYIKVAGKYE